MAAATAADPGDAEAVTTPHKPPEDVEAPDEAAGEAGASAPTAAPCTPLGSAWRALRAARERHGPRVRQFVIVNFLPLGFAVALLVSLTWPLPGKTLGDGRINDVRALQAANNAAVFLVSGLTLNLSDFTAVLKDVRAPLFGLVAILALTPCLAFGALRLPLRPHEFSVGLAIFCVVPTTLGVGVALTTAAKGNIALALALTVSTNLLGIATVPFLLRAVLAGTPGASTVRVDPGDLAVKLVFTCLIPTAVGIALRCSSARLAAWVTANKVGLGVFSNANLVCIVWQTLSAASAVLLRQRAGDVLAVVAIAAGLHLVMLAVVHVAVTRALSLPVRERVAVTIMGAQKSAPVAVTVITYITRSGAQQGLLAIPALVGQLSQIFIGSALARTLAKQVQLADEAQLPAAPAAAQDTPPSNAAGDAAPQPARRRVGEEGAAPAVAQGAPT